MCQPLLAFDSASADPIAATMNKPWCLHPGNKKLHSRDGRVTEIRFRRGLHAPALQHACARINSAASWWRPTLPLSRR